MMDIAEITGGGINSDEAVNNAPSEEFALIEVGWYPAEIEDAEPKENSKKTGYLVAVKAVIMGDKHSNRVVYGNHNIQNPNPVSESIGLAELGQLGQAFGIAHVTTVNELRGKCQIHVKVKAPQPEKGYPKASNQIDGYLALGAEPPKKRATPATQGTPATPPPIPETTAAPVAAPTTTAAPAAAGKMPWQK